MKTKQIELFILAVVVVGVIVWGSGCGSGSTPSSSSPTRVDPSGAASAEFLTPGSVRNSFVKFGKEAVAAERELASEVLHKNFEARAQGDFASQCSTLSLVTIKEFVASPKKPSSPFAACPVALKKIAEPLKSTEQIRADTLEGPIAVLRMKGSRGYALFHGNDKKDYAIPMIKEGGHWKVGALVPTELG
jgi:hypothetical protein